MANNLIQLIPFPQNRGTNGSLLMLQAGSVAGRNAVPFDIKRVLVMQGMQPTDVRGKHTHHKTEQILFAITGGCTVDLDDGTNQASVELRNSDEGLFLPPYLWHTMKNFAPGTILMVVANTPYDEMDYIRSYEEFLKFSVNR